MQQQRITCLLILLCLLPSFSMIAQLKPGSKAPPINISQWVAPSSVPFDLSNKSLIIDFWATWCAPCIAAMPHIDSLQQKFVAEKDIVFLTMSDEPAQRIISALKRFPTNSFVITDTTKATQDSFKIFVIPRTFLIDKNGIIRWIGNPEMLTADIISAFVSGKLLRDENDNSIQSISHTAPAPTEKNKDFYSLYTKYADILKDSTVRSYFEADTIASGNMSASWQNKRGSLIRTCIVGIYFRDLFAHLLKCSFIQVRIPKQYEYKKLSYCLKYPLENSMPGENQIALDSILNFLRWNETVKNKKINYYKLTVFDSVLLKKSHSADKNGSSSMSVSDGQAILGFKNCTLDDVASQLSKLFDKKVVLKNGTNNERFYITLRNGSFEEMKKSLLEYGIEVKRKSGRFPVYYFGR